MKNCLILLVSVFFIISCGKEDSINSNKHDIFIKSIEKNGSNEFGVYKDNTIKYIDEKGVIYDDFKKVEQRIKSGEVFMMEAELDPIEGPFHYTDTRDYCCDFLEIIGWTQLPFYPYTGVIGYRNKRYTHHSAIKYFYNIKIWVKGINGSWVLNYNGNWSDYPAECEDEFIVGGGLQPTDEMMGCPAELKKVRIEQRFINDSNIDILCIAREKEFYFEGYPWSLSCE